jgi:hypothetical protein
MSNKSIIDLSREDCSKFFNKYNEYKTASDVERGSKLYDLLSFAFTVSGIELTKSIIDKEMIDDEIVKTIALIGIMNQHNTE